MRWSLQRTGGGGEEEEVLRAQSSVSPRIQISALLGGHRDSDHAVSWRRHLFLRMEEEEEAVG